MEKAILAILTPENVSIATKALGQLQKRSASLDKQWQLTIQRCQYNVDIAQRRFEQVDPANRLVAAALEKNWNRELEKLALAQQEYQEYQNQKQPEFTTNSKEIIDLAGQIPTLWSKTNNLKDKKRIVRLLISDITITKDKPKKLLFLDVRWQGGATQHFQVKLPLTIADKLRYPMETVDKVRALTMQYGDDRQTVAALNRQGLLAATSKPFTRNMIAWIRYKYHIDKPLIKSDQEFTVTQVQQMFQISRHMVYYWINRKYVIARKKSDNRFLIEITPEHKQELYQMIKTSYKATTMSNHSRTAAQ
jgi:hypothetical protein